MQIIYCKHRTKGGTYLKEKKRDKNIVKDAVGDPAFYNDQIDKNKKPIKEAMEKGKSGKCKSGL